MGKIRTASLLAAVSGPLLFVYGTTLSNYGATMVGVGLTIVGVLGYAVVRMAR